MNDFQHTVTAEDGRVLVTATGELDIDRKSVVWERVS
jgi:hypothetical protein